MNKLLEIVNYVFEKYPKVDELSKPRLVKLIFLIDWKFAINTGEQFTDIKWYFNHYGPYVDDVLNLVKKESEIFNVISTPNSYGGSSDKITKIKRIPINLNSEVKTAADFIIDKTWKLNWSDFISLVYSSFPIKNNSKYTYLNLSKEAREFKKFVEQK
jgi:hypothetical protein